MATKNNPNRSSLLDNTGTPNRENPARAATLQRQVNTVVSDVTERTRALVGVARQNAGEDSVIRDDALLGTTIPRNAWVMSCQSWLDISSDARNPRYLVLRCNPSEVQWRAPQRAQEQKTHNGTILHVWRDPVRRTYFDELQLSINFQAGNIMPMETGTSDLKIPPGLHNFYTFLELVDEQKIISTGDGFGQTNFVYIWYNSLIFPQITLAGLFTPEGPSWTDGSQDPANMTWSANFTVYHSYPEMKQRDLVEFFINAGFPRRSLSKAEREELSNISDTRVPDDLI